MIPFWHSSIVASPDSDRIVNEADLWKVLARRLLIERDEVRRELNALELLLQMERMNITFQWWSQGGYVNVNCDGNEGQFISYHEAAQAYQLVENLPLLPDSVGSLRMTNFDQVENEITQGKLPSFEKESV